MSANILERPAVRAAQGESSGEGVALTSAREIPAWAVSLVVHLVLLVALNAIINPSPPKEELDTIIDSALAEELSPEALRFEVAKTDEIGSDADLNTISPGREAAQEVASTPQVMEQQIQSEFKLNPAPMRPQVEFLSQAEFTDYLTSKGGTDYPGGVKGAIDRLTQEIAGSLRERKTLVIWMMDASLSLRDRREAIADRIENVYKQLGQLEVGQERALKSAVVSFGEKTTFMTEEPVDSAAEVAKAIRSMKDDESGKELVFSAIHEATKRWKDYRTKMGRNILVFIVTDERGDDFQYLEDVIAFNRRYGIRVYCVGNAAPFGREQGYVTWRYEDGTFEDLPVDQGPETVRPEYVRLAFWGVNAQDLDRLSSNFGPYALTRLCAETGGMYFVAEESRGSISFDMAVMRSYAPDYRPIAVYDKELATNMAKQALMATATKTMVEGKDIPIPTTVFPADNDTVLRQALTEAQKPLSVLDYKLDEMQRMLEAGEKDRAKLTAPRWRAGFDLAMGRVLAMRVRSYGYNAVLAEMKVTPRPFQKKGSNRWRLVASDKITAGPQVKKLADRAKEYLKRVIDEHPGTPWAALAEREITTPMGWDWQEFAVAVQPPRPQNESDDPVLRLADEEKKKAEMKRKMQEKQRVRPKL